MLGDLLIRGEPILLSRAGTVRGGDVSITLDHLEERDDDCACHASIDVPKSLAGIESNCVSKPVQNAGLESRLDNYYISDDLYLEELSLGFPWPCHRLR